MTLTRGSKALIRLGLICGLQLILMLAFRAFWYTGIYIAPEDAYGLADIIELLLGLIFFLLLAVSVLVSLVLLFRGLSQTRKVALSLIVWSLLLYQARGPLRHLAAVYAS